MYTALALKKINQSHGSTPVKYLNTTEVQPYPCESFAREKIGRKLIL